MVAGNCVDQTTFDSERDAGSGGDRSECKMMTEQCDQSVAVAVRSTSIATTAPVEGLGSTAGRAGAGYSVRAPRIVNRSRSAVVSRDTAVVTTSPSTTAWTVVRSAHRVTVRPAKPFPIQTCCAPTRSTTPDGGMRSSIS
ncbi:hypothetical protein D8W71_02270 [Rhodococcus sp. P1Y]|nr:hypothetical protein D8W71_02270 [Rhodococcus sp. P1Y]